jgi:hypothetical protein
MSAANAIRKLTLGRSIEAQRVYGMARGLNSNVAKSAPKYGTKTVMNMVSAWLLVKCGIFWEVKRPVRLT